MQEELKKIVEATGNIRAVADYALQALEESNEVRGKLEKMIASQGKKITVLKGEVRRLQRSGDLNELHGENVIGPKGDWCRQDRDREAEEMWFQRSGEGNWWCQKTGDEEMEIPDKELKMSSRIIKLEKENQELREELEEGDYWQKRHLRVMESSCCPECYDSEGHNRGCAVGEDEEEIKRLRGALKDIMKLSERRLAKSVEADVCYTIAKEALEGGGD